MLYSLSGVRFKAGKFPEAGNDIEKVLLFSPEYEGGIELQGKIRERLCA